MNIQFESAIVDFAVAGDKRIVEKQNEKNSKDVEHENCVGDKDCCRIIRKCDEELAGKLDITIIVSLPPKNYATRKGKDFKKSIRGLE